MREHLVWVDRSTLSSTICRIGHVLRVEASHFEAPNRAIVELVARHWEIKLWHAASIEWILQETTYDDLETAKAVAVALVAMELHA